METKGFIPVLLRVVASAIEGRLEAAGPMTQPCQESQQLLRAAKYAYLLQAILLNRCPEQLDKSACPIKLLEHLECGAKLLLGTGANTLTQQQQFVDGHFVQQVCHC